MLVNAKNTPFMVRVYFYVLKVPGRERNSNTYRAVLEEARTVHRASTM
jgi:hypothetical protein